MLFITYILQSKKVGRYYVGYTSDLNKRIAYHNAGKNKSTKFGIPWRLVYLEEFASKKEAWLREKEIKSYKGGEAFKRLLK